MGIFHSPMFRMFSSNSFSCNQGGNQIAHAGDVKMDICLIKNELMGYNEAFRALHGLDWRMALELIGTQIYFYQSPLPTALSDTIPLLHPHMVE